MRPLIKVVLTLFVFFSTMLVVAKATGLLDFGAIEHSLAAMRTEGAPWWVGAAITGLLFADLVIAVPTLEISILGGHVLGFLPGFLHGLAGVTAAGVAGYWLCRWKGDVLVRRILRDPAERAEMQTTFRRYGVVMIFLSRAVPVLPEVSACLSGATGMSFGRFLAAWLTVNVPYMAIASWSGAVSTLERPFPAIAAFIGLTVVFWCAWWLVRQRAERLARAVAATD